MKTYYCFFDSGPQYRSQITGTDACSAAKALYKEAGSGTLCFRLKNKDTGRELEFKFDNFGKFSYEDISSDDE
jgi:hypothetical protein